MVHFSDGTTFGGSDALQIPAADPDPAVPEPGTWALLVGASSLIGGQTINVNSGTYNDALAYVTTDANGSISGTWSTLGNEGDWSGFQMAYPVAQGPAPAAFFNGANNLGSNAYYLAFTNGNIFGYYEYLTDPHFIYHFDLGFEYVFDAADGHSGVFFYDFKSNDYFYTSPTFSFPYPYDFGLQAFLYYYPDPTNPQRYNTNGMRYFYNFSTGKIISK